MNKIFNKNNNVKIDIHGDNNIVIFGENTFFNQNNYFRIGVIDVPVNNCIISIGSNVTSNGIFITVNEDNTKVIIGDDCMFSDQVQIYASDTHSIFDNDSKQLINIGKYIEIGNHVWVCTQVFILKNTKIPDNCIVGARAVVSGNKFDKNCILAGIPARIVKRNINWSRLRPKQFLNH